MTTSNIGAGALSGAWTCRVQSGTESGRAVAVGSRPLTIGAGEECDLVLSDPAVSRRHTEIQLSAEGILVRDLGSTNGTFYRSSRITEAVLKTEATIQVGETSLLISSRPPPTVPPSGRDRFGGLVGHSLGMREVFAVLELASPAEVTVLIEGESGTGKEVAARAIHDHSLRAEKPFVVVDCSATQEQLIDSQLFGHRRGAFTGAVANRKGAFVEASSGTLFLDEIGELPLPSQGKLLRALEARTVQPLGSDRPAPVDTRVVVATHRDLGQMVENNQFRFDLYQRLAVVHVRIPPLRERLEDLPVLIRHFYEGRDVEPGEIDGAKLRQIEQHDWRGNVRELRNALERAWVLSGTAGLAFSDLPLDLHTSTDPQPTGAIDVTLPFKEAKERWVEGFERRYLASLYAACQYKVGRTAERAGINRNHIRKLLAKYDLLK